MKKRFLFSKILVFGAVFAMSFSTVALAAEIPDNSDTCESVNEEEVMQVNNGIIYGNYGTVVTNDVNGDIYTNRGTVTSNKGVVRDNFGHVTNDGGTVLHNLGGTITGGTAKYDYVYKMDTTAAEHWYFYSAGDDPEDIMDIGGTVYITEGASIVCAIETGYVISENMTPTVTGGTITADSDGTYTLTDITEDIVLTAPTTYAPVTDITISNYEIPVEYNVELKSLCTITPENAGYTIMWEVIEAGTTNAVIDDPYVGNLFATDVGSVTVLATIEDGKEIGEPFTKEFTLEIVESEEEPTEENVESEEESTEENVEEDEEESTKENNEEDNTGNKNKKPPVGLIIGIAAAVVAIVAVAVVVVIKRKN